MTQLSPTALEEAAKALDELPLSDGDRFGTLIYMSDYIHPGSRDDMRCASLKILNAVATAAITAYLAQAGKEGWVMVPLNPNYDMGEAGMAKFASFHDEHPAACVDEIYRAMLAAAQNGGDPPRHRWGGDDGLAVFWNSAGGIHFNVWRVLCAGDRRYLQVAKLGSGQSDCEHSSPSGPRAPPLPWCCR